jgi:hypothetical protein
MDNDPLTNRGHPSASFACYMMLQQAGLPTLSRLLTTMCHPGAFMYLPLYVENRDVLEAQTLIECYGKAAGLEASERAETSRNIGNHINYCRWRQIERLVIMLNVETVLGTIH